MNNVDLLYILDLKYKQLAILNNNSSDCATNIILDETSNQIAILKFDMPLSSPNIKYIRNEYLLKYKNEFYIITNPNYSRDDNKLTVQIEAKHLAYQLATKYNFAIINNINQLAEVNEINKNPLELMNVLLQDSCGWTVGGISDSLMTELKTLQSKEKSILANLVDVAQLFEAFLYFNSTEKTVSLFKELPDRYIQIRKGKNLKNLNISYDSSEICTRLFCFGGNNIISGNEVSIIGINQNPTGTALYAEYIDNIDWYLSQKDEYGNQLYTKEFIYTNQDRFIKQGVWRNSNYTDETLLYNAGIEKLKKLSIPLIKGTVTGLDLSTIDGYFVDSPLLNEKVYIIDEDLGISFTANIIKITRNGNNPLDLQIEISNEIPYSNIFTSISDTILKTNINTDNLGNTKGNYISGVIDVMRTRLNSTQSHWKTDDSGGLLFESEDGFSALKLSSGILGLANSKNPDGSYAFRTFATGTGIVADELKTGIITGGKVSWNLETGSLRLGNSDSDYQLRYDSGTNTIDFKGKIKASQIDVTTAKITTAQIENLVVGTNVTMGASATISWGNVTGTNDVALKTDIPSMPDLSGYATQTLIGDKYVITSYVRGDKIDGGLITGCTLKTNPTDTGGYLDLNQQYIKFYKSTTHKMTIGFDDSETNTGVYFANGSMIANMNFGGAGNGIWIIGIDSICLSSSLIKFSTTPKVGNVNVLTEASTVVAKFA